MLKRKLRAVGRGVAAVLLPIAVPLVPGHQLAAAQGAVVTETYQIGNGSVSSATVFAMPSGSGASALYNVGFTTPSALAKGATITVADPSASTVFPSALSDYYIVDGTSSLGDQAVSSSVLAPSAHAVTVGLSAALAAGSSVSVRISGVTNPPKPGTYNLEVSTSANPGPASTANYQITPAAPLTFSPAASPALVGGSSTYTIGAFKSASSLPAGSLISIASTASSGTSDDVGFPTSASAYKVTVLTATASSTPSSVSVAGVGSSSTGQSVTLKLSTAVASGDELSVTATGVHNPSSPQTDTISAAAPSTATPVTASLQIGTSVSGATISLSQPAAGASGVRYVIGFKADSPIPAGGTITLVAPAGTSFAGVSASVADTTHPSGSGNVAPSSVKASSSTSSLTDNLLTITAPKEVFAGDQISLQVSGVTNPPSGDYGGPADDFTVATSADVVPLPVPAYQVTAAAAPTFAAIAVSPTTPATAAQYTVSDLKAAAAMSAGISTIQVEAPSGTVLPSNVADFTVTDLSDGVGTAHPVSLSTSASNEVTLKLGANIASGAFLELTAAGVLNPGPGIYEMTLAGDVVAATPPPPSPATSATSVSLTASPSPALIGARVAFLAAVHPPLSLGSMTFTDNGAALPGCAGVPVHSGIATCAATLGTIGTAALRAVYSGASSFAGSTSAALNVQVENVASIAVSTRTNPTKIGQAVTYSAIVKPAASRGTVTFTKDGAVVPACSSVRVVVGQAKCKITFYSGGRHVIAATYSGTVGVARSTSLSADESVSFPPIGYWLVTTAGTVYGEGGAPALGSTSTNASSGEAVGIAKSPGGRGYWVVTSRGTVAAFGTAHFYGDLPSIKVQSSDIVAIAPTHDGHGYWLVGRDGGMFAFGDAKFHGSVPGLKRHVHDIVGMVASADGAGYLVVGSDGGVFTFGSARFHGSVPGIGKHVNDIRAILPSSTGTGYVLVGADGGAFIFGKGVDFLGSLPSRGIKTHDIVGIALTPDNGGYFMAASDGNVYGFGDAKPFPKPSGLTNTPSIVAIAGT
ncbi:MAG TPA: Ig-like domain repeat protein [Acidimicrobiales bacterium]|nr:Ig-like domain repeat protein [Acidimicrobiales bacterium]